VGVARAVGAVSFALVIGLLMQLIYRRDERARAASQKSFVVGTAQGGRPLGDTAAFFALQVAVLVFANWAPASAEDSAVWHAIFAWKWPLTALAGVGLAALLIGRWRWNWQPLAATAGVVALLAWLVLRETLAPGQWAGFLVIIAGIVMVSLGGTAGNHFNAIGYAVLAMLCFGLTNFFLKLAGARGCDSLAAAIVLWLSVGACGVLAASWHLLRFSRIPALGRWELSWLALLAGMLLALGMLAVKKAVTLGPAGPASAVSGSNAIVVSILDLLVLGHGLPFLKLAGMLAVIVGIAAFALARPVKNDHSSAA